MDAIYCETHERFELMVRREYGSLTIMTLNEQAQGPHHLAKDNPSMFAHAGELSDCKLCSQKREVGIHA